MGEKEGPGQQEPPDSRAGEPDPLRADVGVGFEDDPSIGH